MSYTKKSIRSSLFSFEPLSVTVIITVFVAMIVLFSYLFFLRTENRGSVKEEATLILSFENGGKGRVFQGEVVDGMTVLEALRASSEAGQIDLKYSFDAESKVAINALNGYFKDSDVKISFYLNNNHIDTGYINKIPISGGDIIEARLE